MGLLDILRGKRELKQPAHDRLFAMSAPFAGDPVAIGRVAGRYVRSYWSDADLAVVVMRTRQDGEVAVAFDPDAQGSEAIGGADLLAPGQRLLTRTNDRGRDERPFPPSRAC